MSFSAILSASRTTADTPAGLRASLHFAGQTLIEYQARQAARAGADRIMILVSVITPAVSQAVDRLSADGIAVALVRDMVSMVRDVPRDADVLLVADVLYDKANLPLLDVFLQYAHEVWVADSRVKNFAHPRYHKVTTLDNTTTLPDMDEAKQFNQVVLYRSTD